MIAQTLPVILPQLFIILVLIALYRKSLYDYLLLPIIGIIISTCINAYFHSPHFEQDVADLENIDHYIKNMDLLLHVRDIIYGISALLIVLILIFFKKSRRAVSKE